MPLSVGLTRRYSIRAEFSSGQALQGKAHTPVVSPHGPQCLRGARILTRDTHAGHRLDGALWSPVSARTVGDTHGVRAVESPRGSSRLAMGRDPRTAGFRSIQQLAVCADPSTRNVASRAPVIRVRLRRGPLGG